MERESKVILVLILIGMILGSSPVFCQKVKNNESIKSVFLVDTIIMKNPVEVLYEYKGKQIAIYLEKKISV